MDYRKQLLTLSETFGRATGRSEARVATMVANDGKFFGRIRSGKTCSVDTYLRLKDWFAANWPEGTPWPDGVDEPGVAPKAA